MSLVLLQSCKRKLNLYLNNFRDPSLENKNRFTVYQNKLKKLRITAENKDDAPEFSKYNAISKLGALLEQYGKREITALALISLIRLEMWLAMRN